ncbi:MAG: tRNA pseudouridine synthase D [Planctomycetes bacterium ADurb.Bin126]|nr:MAG: tRNA pseudouridine synthase D [Planctomycetes bacterium ADurb.Bin126]HOD81465.1 tRNA pseudouridine(13) synthase TruD [Phycisphaerae bacterium]HQL75499.1 tRNA pseudouridine(13) synthase TruD [Phycisphaerae bacterium]
MTPLAYLTADLPGIGGRIKDKVDDFLVEELPLYPLSGSGTHVYFKVRKAGLPTPAAVARIARHMGVRPDAIGVAGMKDAQAVTTQMMSLEHADLHRLRAFRDSQVQLSVEALHGNKLRAGLLAGNRFQVRIRGVGELQLEPARRILTVLERRGCPNYFGLQRFGARSDTGDLGRCLVRNDLEEFVRIFLGRSHPDDPPDCRSARDAFDAGFYQRAMDCWPRHFADQRKALAAYKRKHRPVQAVMAVDKRMKRLFVSAFQSELFNAVQQRRVQTLDRLLGGDLAQIHASGACFRVEDPVAEQSRSERFEISPTGPILGYRSSLAEGEAGTIEHAVLDEAGIAPDDFRHVGSLKIKGSRRPLRFRLENVELTAGEDARGPYLQLAFSAAAGCYATVALRELMKTPELG